MPIVTQGTGENKKRNGQKTPEKKGEIAKILQSGAEKQFGNRPVGRLPNRRENSALTVQLFADRSGQDFLPLGGTQDLQHGGPDQLLKGLVV